MKSAGMLVGASGLMSALPAMSQEGAAASVEPEVPSLSELRAVYVLDPSGLTTTGKLTLVPLEADSVAWHVPGAAPATPRDTVAAQTPQLKDGCFLHNRPAPACRFFGVTDFGVAFGTRDGHRTGRVIGDFGVMWNLGATDAVGVSWFVTTDEIGRTGPAVRYRRWLTGTQSLDVAVGLPTAVSQGYLEMEMRPGGSLLGLVKYNPLPWIGVVVRPEVVRLRAGYDCSTEPGVGITDSFRRVLVGVEFGEKPGAIISGVLWGFTGLLSLVGGR